MGGSEAWIKLATLLREMEDCEMEKYGWVEEEGIEACWRIYVIGLDIDMEAKKEEGGMETMSTDATSAIDWSVAAIRAAHLQGERVSWTPSMAYWHEKLPTTPMPEALKELISANDEKVEVNVGKGGVKVNVGMPPRKVGTQKQAKGVGRCVAGINYAAITQMPRDISLCMLLLEKDLVGGTKVPLTFLHESIPNSHQKYFLPRAVADEIPFSSDKLSVALKELNIAPDSITALAMKETLQDCESPAMKGETKFCPTSLEAMIDFTTSKLGSNRLTVLATNFSKTSKSVRQEYTITGVKYESKEDKAVYYCHSSQYPYAVYLCHDLQGTRTARVWVKGEDGSTVEAAAICHTKTSSWNPDNMVFQVLNVKPGAASICHLARQGDVLWLTAD
ncbi:BURP domain-containing protein 5-like [Cryptomeria japonica]|uniref:BURP domain-containing protein 5-like n=1 Tax=Cryptomeria japonica TaxID=3369 RepID=UPI0027D9E49A|nr:BURP domain-containing protein 5-like [Cryptomeria japonica]XP_059070842.1 BURP domain-containing protein 5-like [Cryptomeria japonica]XP_059070843.1 BURP domain-containing protein 5-like [Cryptomeria japonica]XP_059070845.1 BURP domain-containing protein 5-like [Cryptomeria japonica]XP_059070847.1 BURP domain-containing protein 5-like [Cryptomeria japonica]XP_059070848.1 BURP domain-containing protein 5-like [Cryptomeria japonica]XP_059070849.1 BURP domain-containing protein 5-like [Crypt